MLVAEKHEEQKASTVLKRYSNRDNITTQEVKK